MRRELKCVKNIYEEEKITHVALSETFATIGLPGFGLRCVCVGIAKFSPNVLVLSRESIPLSAKISACHSVQKIFDYQHPDIYSKK